MTRNAGLAIGRTPWRTPRCRRLVVGAGVRDLLDRAKILFFGANLRARARDLADAGGEAVYWSGWLLPWRSYRVSSGRLRYGFPDGFKMACREGRSPTSR